MGILVGLQITEWNQARLDRQEAEYHLSFLYDELSEEIASVQAEIERNEKTALNGFQVTMLLNQRMWEEGDYQRVKELIPSTYEFWGPNIAL